MNIAQVCIALLLLLTVASGFYVSMMRAKTRTVTSHDNDPANPLTKAIRAQGNTVEYAPALALAMYIISQYQPPFWVLVVMILATASRFSLFFGLITCPTMAKPHPLRFIGALGTYIFGLILCFYLLFRAAF